jgi:hypothetical protein
MTLEQVQLLARDTQVFREALLEIARDERANGETLREIARQALGFPFYLAPIENERNN